MFVLFGGEEMGLMGSSYFAAHLPSAFEKVDAMFNFDMEGEGDGAFCSFSPNLEDMKRILEDANKKVNILRNTGTIRGVGVRSSDFAPFFEKGVPCASFHSNGPHLAYHQTGDTIYRINPEIMGDIARLAFLCGYIWGNR
jgi:Zn-dependent M28 family amino/carboxypeptidase